MTDKIIDEVMELVEEFARASKGFPDYYTLEDVVSAKNDIRATLREVLDRKPLSDEDAKRLWASTPFIDCPEGGIALVRATEKFHNIGAE